MGRRKIEMTLVKDSSSRQVTFSKHRLGLFKKANELATLCGAEVAIVTFSLGGKPFSLGQPSVDVLLNRFLHRLDSKSSGSHGHGRSTSSKVDKLNKQLTKLMSQLHVEKKKSEKLDKNITLKKKKLLSIEKLDLIKLQNLKDSVEELQDVVELHKKEMERSSRLMFLAESALEENERERNILATIQA